MSLPVIARIVIVGALVVIASSATAQSLGDVARQEEARRAAVKAAARAKVLTNADLAADPNTGATAPASAVAVPAPPAASVVAPASASPGNASVAAVTAAAPADTKPKEDEASWRRRAADLRARVEKAQKMVDGFAGGTAAEDPREQARVETLIKRAQNELTRAGDALRRLMMQADAAGVPPAWVR